MFNLVAHTYEITIDNPQLVLINNFYENHMEKIKNKEKSLIIYDCTAVKWADFKLFTEFKMNSLLVTLQKNAMCAGGTKIKLRVKGKGMA